MMGGMPGGLGGMDGGGRSMRFGSRVASHTMTPMGTISTSTIGRQHHSEKHGQSFLSGGTRRLSVSSTLYSTLGAVPGRAPVDEPQTEWNVSVSITKTHPPLYYLTLTHSLIVATPWARKRHMNFAQRTQRAHAQARAQRGLGNERHAHLALPGSSPLHVPLHKEERLIELHAVARRIKPA